MRLNFNLKIYRYNKNKMCADINMENNPIFVELRNIWRDFQGPKPKIMMRAGQPTKLFEKFNRKLLEEGKTFKYIGQIQNPSIVWNPITKKLGKKNIFDKRKTTPTLKPSLKDKIIRDGNNLLRDNGKLRKQTDEQYKDSVLVGLNSLVDLIDEGELNIKDASFTIDLTKISMTDLVNLFQTNADIFVGKNIVASVQGSDKWISFSQSNLLKLADFEKLRGDEYSQRVGSDNEFIINAIKNPFIIIKFITYDGSAEVNNGGFFKYYHTTKFNLKR
jgi:hypothetical protein